MRLAIGSKPAIRSTWQELAPSGFAHATCKAPPSVVSSAASSTSRVVPPPRGTRSRVIPPPRPDYHPTEEETVETVDQPDTWAEEEEEVGDADATMQEESSDSEPEFATDTCLVCGTTYATEYAPFCQACGGKRPKKDEDLDALVNDSAPFPPPLDHNPLFPPPLPSNESIANCTEAGCSPADGEPSGCIHFGGTDDFDEENYEPEEPPAPLELSNDAYYSAEQYGQDPDDWIEVVLPPVAIGAGSQRIWKKRKDVEQEEREQERKRKSEIDRKTREEREESSRSSDYQWTGSSYSSHGGGQYSCSSQDQTKNKYFALAQATPKAAPMALCPPAPSDMLANSAQLPDKLTVHVSGRGSNKRQQVNLPAADAFEAKVVKLQCPHGCRLRLKTEKKTKTFVEIHVRSQANKGTPQKIVIHGFKTNDTFCPECSKHMAFSLNADKDKGEESKSKTKQGNAFMACLWAPADDDRENKHTRLQRYITDALVLGFSLSQECPTVSRILLVTADVMEVVEVELLKLYWEVRPVQHVRAHPSRLDSSKVEARFSSVFTKLRCWEQDEFLKICILDLDMVLTRGIDEIFGNQAPAALFRGNSKNESDARNGATLYDRKTGEQQGGINAGCMVIEPSIETFNHMAGLLKGPGNSTSAPEQDFLSIYFGEQWKKLHVKYNFQPHQLKYVAARGLEGTQRQQVSEVAVWHYSGDVTPRDYLFRQAFVSQPRGSKLALIKNKDCQKAANITEFAKALAQKWGCGQVAEEDEKNMTNAVMLWYEAFEKMWNQLIVTTVGEGNQYCLACDDQDPSLEHAFCYCCKTKSFFNTWRSDPRYKVEGRSVVSTLMDHRELYPASLSFVANVYQMRHPDGAQLENAGDSHGSKPKFNQKAIGGKPRGDSHAQEGTRVYGGRKQGGGGRGGQGDNRRNDRRGGEGKGGKGKQSGGKSETKSGGKSGGKVKGTAPEQDQGGGQKKLLRPTIPSSEFRRRAEEVKEKENEELKKQVAWLTDFVQQSQEVALYTSTASSSQTPPKPKPKRVSTTQSSRYVEQVTPRPAAHAPPIRVPIYPGTNSHGNKRRRTGYH